MNKRISKKLELLEDAVKAKHRLWECFFFPVSCSQRLLFKKKNAYMSQQETIVFFAPSSCVNVNQSARSYQSA